MIKVNIKAENQQLECVLSILYLLNFKKSNTKVQILIHSGSKVNAMTLAYMPILGLYIQLTDVRAQKNDSFMISTYNMVLTNFQLENK